MKELGIELLRIEKELKKNVELIDKLREEKEDLKNELKNLEGRLSAVIEGESKVETMTDFPKIERGVEQRNYKLDPKAPNFTSTNSELITDWIKDIEIYMNLASFPEDFRHKVEAGYLKGTASNLRRKCSS